MNTLQRIGLMFAAAGLIVGAREAAATVQRYHFGINETASLPNWAFIVDYQNRRPRRDDAVQFPPPPNRYYPAGAQFVKRVYGLPGDRVERRGREYFINGRDVGYAKERSKAGYLTTLGPTGVIPPGHYYVGTPSPDGLDSRYGEIGWIRADRIVGVASTVL